jgi:hypothetical protein
MVAQWEEALGEGLPQRGVVASATAARSEQSGIETEGFVPEDPHPVHLWMAWIE